MRTRTIPDYVHVCIIVVGLIQFEPARSILGVILVPLPFLVAGMMKSGSMGGGDIKLMGACGFLLGTMNGYIASIIGLTLAVVFSRVYKIEKYSGVPLAPFLGIGCLVAYLNV